MIDIELNIDFLKKALWMILILLNGFLLLWLYKETK